MGSPRGKLSSLDWRKIGTGLGVGVAGAVLAWVTASLVPALEAGGDEGMLLLAAVLAAGANAVRKWLSDTTVTNRRNDK